MDKEYLLREATTDDIPTLVRHNSMMFEETITLQGEKKDNSKFTIMNQSYDKKLHDELGKSSFRAWIIERNNKPVASGSVSICSMVSSPDDPSYLRGYIHSVYTETSDRRKGLSVKIIQEIKKYCHQRGINHIFLRSTDSGKHLYESAGFKPLESVMFHTQEQNSPADA